MPTSDSANLSPIIHTLLFLQPKKLLDLGVGFGKYGALAREYLDVAQTRVHPDDWEVQIDGVEGFQSYRSSPLWDAYNTISLEDIREHYTEYTGYDVVLFIDALEHIERPQGDAILEHLLVHNKNVIVSCPSFFAPQKTVNGNVLETHLSQWNEEDFTVRGGKIIHRGVCNVAHIAWKKGL
jgi:2-polyprenyl-3-methyl-5-hydroxy-6-metoxy-1,4-benzoquinol methylase